ncbi:MAG: DUF4241 domain-containing protein [Clostridiales bacterium]|nr:DUF4241 domain-containing protein [Clostridiales bacterium]
MKITIKIPKSRITAPIDFGTVLTAHSACGVKLSYTEYDFMQVSGKIVMFDGYSGAHKYAPFDVECGLIAFPFFCGCATDGGERVAYAGLRFGEEKATEWKPLISKDALARLATDADAGGTPIPSGVCCFADEQGYKLYRSHVKDEVPPLAGLIVLDGQTHAAIELYGKRYAVFSAGWGDGRYNCYAGLTEGGKVTAIIADFGMIDYGKRDDTPIDVEVETTYGELYVYDPSKSEFENNVARQTMIIENSSDDAERLRAYSRRGYAYHCANDIDRALSDYLSAVECSKTVTDRGELSRAWSVYDNAAEIFCARSDHQSAIKLMLDALEVKDTFYAGAFVRLIDLYLLVKHSDKALEIAERMRALRPDDPVAHMKYAECCVSVMEYANAAAAYNLLATQFGLYENLFDEASCYIELGDYEKAAQALNAHPAKENYEQYWYYRAFIEYNSHNLWMAREFAEKAHGLDNAYMPALYLLIDVESLLNEYYAVARYAEEYKKLRPDNEYGYSVCGEAHLLLGNFSECARNYYHIYRAIKNDDKYAALAAIVGTKTGEFKRSNALLKKLRRKKSAYYNAARYGMYITKSRARNVALEREVYNLGSDDDFLLTLAVFLYKTDDVVHSMRVLDTLYKGDHLPFEAIAQQIRAAEKIGDKRHFLSFLEYYINNFISPAATTEERIRIAESFIVNSSHRSWIREIRK